MKFTMQELDAHSRGYGDKLRPGDTIGVWDDDAVARTGSGYTQVAITAGDLARLRRYRARTEIRQTYDNHQVFLAERALERREREARIAQATIAAASSDTLIAMAKVHLASVG